MTIRADDDDDADDDWTLDESKPEPCERCGLPSLPIVYGMPGPELVELAERGAVILGGCVIRGDEPTHQCGAGHTAWRRPPR